MFTLQNSENCSNSAKKHHYLAVVGRGENKHLTSVHLNCFGRLIRHLGWSNSSMKKVVDYIKLKQLANPQSAIADINASINAEYQKAIKYCPKREKITEKKILSFEKKLEIIKKDNELLEHFKDKLQLWVSKNHSHKCSAVLTPALENLKFNSPLNTSTELGNLKLLFFIQLFTMGFQKAFSRLLYKNQLKIKKNYSNLNAPELAHRNFVINKALDNFENALDQLLKKTTLREQRKEMKSFSKHHAKVFFILESYFPEKIAGVPIPHFKERREEIDNRMKKILSQAHNHLLSFYSDKLDSN
jgi:hypothetical protein